MFLRIGLLVTMSCTKYNFILKLRARDGHAREREGFAFASLRAAASIGHDFE